MDYLSENYRTHYDENPSDILQEKEYTTNLSADLEALIKNAPLSDKQRQQLIMYYYEEKTLSEIGNCFGVTREAIRQNIHKAISILQSSVTV